jgi:flagellar protein FlaJ
VYFDRRYRIALWAVSFSVFFVLLSLLIIQRVYVPTSPYFIPIDQRLNNSIILGLIVALVFPAIVETNNIRWLRQVDENTPRLLMDVTEAVRSGMPLIQALEGASTRDYGPISQPLAKAMVKFRMTSDLESALKGLGDSLIQPVVRQMSTILLEAYETGGRVIDVLSTSVELFSNLAEYREERVSQTRPYIFVVYLGTLIFLVISWVILAQFLGPLHAAATDPGLEQTGILRSLLDIKYYKAILFWAAVMESVFGGLVAGKIGSGRISAGLLHTVMLLSTTVAFFNVFSV